MVIYLPAVFLFLYLFFRLIWPLPISKRRKTLLAVLLFVVSQEHLIKGLFFGGLASPELPPIVLMIQGWLFVSLIFIFLIALAWDILNLIGTAGRFFSNSPAGGSISPERRSFLLSGAVAVPAVIGAKKTLAAGLFSVPTAAYGVRQAVSEPIRRDFEVSLPRLPRELDGLRLIHVSDLHVSPLLTRDWVQELTDKINQAEPDLILITGDLVDGLPSRRMESMMPLRDLKAEYGVLACPGNHEYYVDYQGWMMAFSDLGLEMLVNEHRVLTIKGRDLVVAGLADPAALRFNLAGPDLHQALKGAPKKALRILLDHRPVQAPQNASHDIDLQLSGHTHGGQLPGMTQITSLANNGYLHGWYQVGNMPMYVTSGAGLWNGFPVRLGVPGEVVQLSLRHRSSPNS